MMRKKFCSQGQTQGAGQMHPRDFVGFFGGHLPAGSTKRQAGPAGAANSAAFALRAGV